MVLREVCMGGTVLFVCPHGAGKSRIAAAWFDAYAPPGWRATTAGVRPQQSVSVHAPRLLAGTAALPFLDQDRPRPLSAAPSAELAVAIDCPPGALPARVVWSLEHGEFAEGMVAVLQTRVVELIGSLPAAAPGGDGGSGGGG
jgi:hypothetical protein